TSALRLGREEARSGQHRATTGGRNPAIRLRMPRNSSRGTATSAIWNKIAAMGDNLCPDLDHLLPQGRQGPVCDRLRQRQGTQEVGEVVGQRVGAAGGPRSPGSSCTRAASTAAST